MSRASVAQHDAQERIVDLQVTVVVDEPELAKLVHEEVHSRPCRADHFGQDFLRDLRKGAVRRFGLTVPSQQQERTGEPLLSGVEQLVDEVFFDSDVPCQHVTQETICERRRRVELPHHLRFLNRQDRRGGDGRRSGHPMRLPREAPLAEEMSDIEQRDNGLLPRVRLER
jgi:hypothetical protein